MSEELSIIASGRLVGRVVRTGNRLTFRYDSSWAEATDAYPLSVSMPLVLEEHPHKVTDAWLRGLLPDNNMVLDQWGKRFHVSPRNPFKLLEHVGEEGSSVDHADAKFMLVACSAFVSFLQAKRAR